MTSAVIAPVRTAVNLPMQQMGAETLPLPLHKEEMCGNLFLQGNNRLQDVQVKVYRTSGEHFAVIYPQKKVCRPLGVINLKNTQVECREDGFTVRQCGADTPMCALHFRTDPLQLERWVSAFSSSKPSHYSLHSLQTPPIMEEEEEDS